MQTSPLQVPATISPIEQGQTEDEIDLRLYWAIFQKHKWRIIRLTLLVGLLAALVSYSLTPVYRSTAALLIESGPTKIVSIEEVYGLTGANREYFQTQLEILKSRSIAERVVDQLQLLKHPEYDPTLERPGFLGLNWNWREWLPVSWQPAKKEPSPKQLRDSVVNAFLGHLEITLLRNSQLVNISFESADPELAAKVPNTLAEVYIESDLEARLQMTQKASGWLTERLAGLRQNLEKSEKTLQDYLEKHELVDISGVKTVAAAQIGEITKSLNDAQAKLSQANSAYRQVQGTRADNYESAPAVLSHPLVQTLKATELELERRVAELARQYGEKHPRMVAAQTELESARANTARQVRLVVDGIRKEYEAASSTVATLQASLRQAEGKVQNIGGKEYELEVLKRDVESNRQLYEMFMTRFKETDVSQTDQSTIGRVVDPAVVMGKPAKPKKSLMVAIALVLGFMLSTLLAFLLEHLDNTLKTSEDVEQKLGLTLLGILPALKLGRKDHHKPQRMFLEDEKSLFAESIRTIRTGIMLSGLDNPHKVLVVTSSVPGEGKTTFAVNQAFALGQMKKTLLLDADMRRPTVHKVFGFTAQLPGLSELAVGSKSLAECIHPLEEAKIDILPSGIIPPNPLELLSSRRFREILALLEEQYEQIVIDGPPTHAVSDALILSSHASAVVYVVKADHTPYQVAQAGLKRLRQVNAPLLGVVLNQLNLDKMPKYYGKYAYYQQAYYGHYKYES
jgi:capsular exopolysaccharide synthesis family protein